jgi:diguanylate cyclase (GGDEF)-like protein/PAS domain S-box-containing protein
VAALALAALALLWSAVAWNHENSEQTHLDDIRRETAGLALLFANQADNTFRSVNHALLELRSTWVNQPSDMGDLVKEYREFLGGAVMQIAIIGADGNLAYSDLGMPKEPAFLGEREHFKVHLGGLQDKLFVSRPLKGKVSGKWSIQLSRPIHQKAQFVGVVVISVDPNYFVKFYQDAGMGKDGAARMIRDSGEIMVRSNTQGNYVGKVINPSRYTSPGAPLQGSFRSKSQADGVERLSSYYRLPQYGLTVMVGPSLDERLAPLRSQLRQIMFVAGVISLLLLLVTWQVLRAMLRKAAAQQELADLHEHVRQSEQRYRSFVENANGLVFELSLEGVFTYVSPNWTDHLGHAMSEVQGHSFVPFVHPDDVAACGAFLQSVLGSDQKQADVEYRVLHKDGTWRWHASSGARMCAADGTVVSFLGIARDVTERTQAVGQLKLNESKFRMLFEASHIGMAMVDHATGDFLEVNEAVLRPSGYTKDEFVKLSYWDITPKEYKAQEMRQMEDLNRIGRFGPNRKEYIRKGGVRYPIEISGFLFTDVNQKKVVWGIIEDITERREAELRQQHHNRVLKMLTDKVPLASILQTIALDVEAVRPNLLCSILLLDAQGKHLRHGAAPSLPDFYTQAIDGMAIGAGVGSCGTAAFTGERVIVQDIATHPYWAPFLDLTRRAGLGSCWSQPILSGTGKVLGTFALYHRQPCDPMPAELLWIEDEALLTALVIEKDAEARQLNDSETRYRHMAQHDALTGLANRALFNDRLQRDLASARRDQTSLALLFIDLDKFKPVNDQHGHAVGDLLLQEVAQRMQACVRDSDTVARIGGDEFVVLLRDVAGKAEALAVANKIRASLEQPFELEGHSLGIGCSAGVALYPQHGADDLTLTNNADYAMYQAKERGRNQVVLYQATGSAPLCGTTRQVV